MERGVGTLGCDLLRDDEQGGRTVLRSASSFLFRRELLPGVLMRLAFFKGKFLADQYL
jgi:hypothetical protein